MNNKNDKTSVDMTIDKIAESIREEGLRKTTATITYTLTMSCGGVGGIKQTKEESLK